MLERECRDVGTLRARHVVGESDYYAMMIGFFSFFVPFSCRHAAKYMLTEPSPGGRIPSLLVTVNYHDELFGIKLSVT